MIGNSMRNSVLYCMREHVVGLQYPEDRFANGLTQFGPRSMTGSTFDLAAYSPEFGPVFPVTHAPVPGADGIVSANSTGWGYAIGTTTRSQPILDYPQSVLLPQPGLIDVPMIYPNSLIVDGSPIRDELCTTHTASQQRIRFNSYRPYPQTQRASTRANSQPSSAISARTPRNGGSNRSPPAQIAELHRCPYEGCEYHTYRKDNVTRHVKSTKHSIRKEYPCPKCGRQMSRKDNCKTHIAKCSGPAVSGSRSPIFVPDATLSGINAQFTSPVTIPGLSSFLPDATQGLGVLFPTSIPCDTSGALFTQTSLSMIRTQRTVGISHFSNSDAVLAISGFPPPIIPHAGRSEGENGEEASPPIEAFL